ncbi:polysaccharide deacetylase family protein [Gorillibacterium timonense]|uniref:polysaccharide deacetylase family protein n=1 Tax=Gorillibacterium timonense TaxID=1689269 RepID=UPI00071D9B34|nr:polysaccharide deacetylase family protein [Gorillibacterium timonense]
MKFRKSPLSSLIALLAVSLLLGSCGITSRSYQFSVDGVDIAKPKLETEHGELYVPASFLKQTLGLDVSWTPVAKQQEHSADGVYYSDRVLPLMYHDISLKEQPGRSSVTTADFRKQMELLRTEGFHVISMDEYVDFLLNKGKVPDNAVLITFDDGYETFYTYAYPILKEFGYPATNFLIVSGVDNPKLAGSPKLKWDQVRKMKQDGMSFYSHTYNQHITVPVDEKGSQKPALMHAQYLKKEKRMETPQEYRDRITKDLAKANERLKAELDNTRNILCFPYGKYSLTTLEVAKSLGIEVMFTTMEGIDTRSDLIGFRMNGSKAGEKPETLINRMKQGDKTLENRETKGILNVNGSALPLSGLEPEVKGDELMVPLREFCTVAKVGLVHDKKHKRIELTKPQ